MVSCFIVDLDFILRKCIVFDIVEGFEMPLYLSIIIVYKIVR